MYHVLAQIGTYNYPWPGILDRDFTATFSLVIVLFFFAHI